MLGYLDIQTDPTLPGAVLKTPDQSRGKPFRVAEVDSEGVTVGTSTGGRVRIRGQVFDTVLKILQDYGAKGDSWLPCGDPSLRDICRHENGGKDCLSYVLPILQHARAVELDGGRPNKVRLAASEEPEAPSEGWKPWGGAQ